MMKNEIWTLTVLLCVAGGMVRAQHGGGHDLEKHGEERVVKLTPEEQREFGIEVGVAGAGEIERYLSLPAEIRPNADRLAHIVPRFSGIVTEVHAELGDRVQAGQALATIESDESLSPFQVKTLISGTVISKHITLGEAVSRERDTYVIADLSTVWVDITLYQRDLRTVRTGQKVTILVGHRKSEDRGTIDYITPVVDEATRTATARVVLPNEGGRWRPGMFVTAKILTERVDVDVAIPGTALHSLDEHEVVFVETEDGFEARDVIRGRAGGGLVEVLDGLEPGERYVIRGGFTLKAELEKASFGSGHAH